MTPDHLKTLRDLVAAGEADAEAQRAYSALPHREKLKADIEGWKAEAKRLARAHFNRVSLEARPALAALLREVDDLRAVADEVNNVYGLIKDNPMFRRLVEAFDAALRDLEPKEAPDA